MDQCWRSNSPRPSHCSTVIAPWPRRRQAQGPVVGDVHGGPSAPHDRVDADHRCTGVPVRVRDQLRDAQASVVRQVGVVADPEQPADEIAGEAGGGEGVGHGEAVEVPVVGPGGPPVTAS